MKSPLVALFLCSLYWLNVSAADFEREHRLADEIIDMIIDGDPEWLHDGQREFLSIYTESDNPKAAVIILHGKGLHPDWQFVVHPLRVGLVEHGYSTLSIQLPVLNKETRYYDYVEIFPIAFPRIEAGIEFLEQQGFDEIVLLAHSCGVHMSMDWIRRNKPDNMDAYIGLGMGATYTGQPIEEPFPLDAIKVPVLDLYGSRDYGSVRKTAVERKIRIEQAGNPLSRQLVITEADHYFKEMDDALVETVASWLDGIYP